MSTVWGGLMGQGGLEIPPAGFVGAATKNRFILDPSGFAATDSTVNTMLEMGMPASLSGAGTLDSIIYLNVGTLAAPLSATRQRVGIQGTVSAADVDKAVGLQLNLYGHVDGVTIGSFGDWGQPLNGILMDGSTNGQGGAFEIFPNSTGEACILAFQHAAVASPVKPASTGSGLYVTDKSTSIVLADGTAVTTATTGTAGAGLQVEKYGAAGANLWLRRHVNGTAAYGDDGSGNHFLDLVLTTGEPILTLTGTAAPATLLFKPAAGQQGRIGFYDGASEYYQLGKGTMNDFFIYDTVRTRNAFQIAPDGNVKVFNAIFSGATAVAAASEVAVGATTAATATNGGGEAMKANVDGYLVISVGGAAKKIPYVAN